MTFKPWLGSVLSLLLVSCQTGTAVAVKTDSATEKGSDSGKKALLVIPPKEFAGGELFIPKKILEQAGIQTVVAGLQVEKATGMDGTTITPDVAVRDVKAADYDLVAIIGGMGTIQYLWDNSEVHALVRDAKAHGKHVAAICSGPVVLARAGLLQGKQSTGFPDPGITNEITKVGAKYTGSEVTVDGKIITGKGPDAADSFGKKLAEMLRR